MEARSVVYTLLGATRGYRFTNEPASTGEGRGVRLDRLQHEEPLSVACDGELVGRNWNRGIRDSKRTFGKPASRDGPGLMGAETLFPSEREVRITLPSLRQ